MKRVAFFVLTVLFVLVQSGCTLPFAQSQGAILYQAVDVNGSPLPQVNVLDASGKFLRQIALPTDTQRLYAVNASFSRYAIFQDYVLQERWFRLDSQTGEYTAYTNFSLEGESVSACGYSSRWVLFCGTLGAYLLNNETGVMTTLPLALDTESTWTMLYVFLVSPDESAFVVYSNTGYWLVTLDAPQNARLLGGENGSKAGAPSFSDDSQQILYTLRSGDVPQIIRESRDGSTSEVLLSGEDVNWASNVPGHDQLVVVRKKSIGLFSLKDQSEETIFSEEDYVRQVMFDPQGKHVVIQWGGVTGSAKSATQWTYVNLESKESTLLGDLEGLSQVMYAPGSKWAYITNTTGEGMENYFYSLDLSSGKTTFLMTTPADSSAQLYSVIPDGTSALVYGFKESNMQFWLLQAEKDKAVLLSNADMAGASLSANGKWVVISAVQTSGDVSVPALLLIDTGNGESKTIGSGFSPVWVKP